MFIRILCFVASLGCLIFSSGCTHTSLAGASPPTGHGGLYSNADRSNPAVIMSDTDITGRINTAYFADSDISSAALNVDTYNGVVTLGGTVTSAKIADKAVNIALSVEGVKTVVPQITIKHSGREMFSANETQRQMPTVRY